MGFIGPTTLLQWAMDSDSIEVLDVFGTRVGRLLELIEFWCAHPDGVGGFNLTHDWFHIARLHAVAAAVHVAAGNVPMTPAAWYEHVQVAVLKSWCVKPVTALDLMLHARKGPMQSLMERDDVRLRRIPAILAEPLAEELTKRLNLPGIYFERRRDGASWQVEKEPDDPDFPGVYLKFGAKGGLKPLGRHVLGVETIDYPLPDELDPDQRVWDLWHELPHELVEAHARYWRTNSTARRYAIQDVELLRGLRRAWNNPPPGDTDSILACKVGAARWRGWSLNIPMLEEVLATSEREMNLAPRAPRAVLAGLRERAGPVLGAVIEDTTAETLERLVKLGGPVGEFAHRVTTARSSEKRADMARKLIAQRRAHFDFKVIGALSGRQSGAGGINAQGVERGPMRHCFSLADPGEHIEGGDFDGFEITIADAVYMDPALRADLEAGKKIHAILGADIYELDPAEVKATDKSGANKPDPLGRGWDGDLYNPAKHGVFTLIYGGQAQKVAETMRIPVETAEAGLERFFKRYPMVLTGMQGDEELFCSMTQPNGPGTRVIWRDPADKVVSLLGFPRFFTLENSLVKFLFELAQDLPSSLQAFERSVRVKRRERYQTPGGAVRSALYAAAFNLQARNMRAARNHRIQATGAGITKELERAIWDQQPSGIHPWVVRPFNVHDEVPCATANGHTVSDVAAGVVERFRPIVPLLKLEWKVDAMDWAGIK